MDLKLTKEVQCLGDESGLVKPLPISNREVKRPSANGSWGLSPSESRLSPRPCASFFVWRKYCFIFGGMYNINKDRRR